MVNINLRQITKTAEDIEKEADNKLSNPFYFNLIMYEIIFHWKFFVVLFFVSEDNILKHYNILKVEYLANILFFNGYSSFDWYYNPYRWLYLIIVGFLLPIGMTILSVWFFEDLFLRKAKLKVETDKLETKRQTVNIEKRFLEVSKQEIKIVSAQKRIKEEKKNILDDEDKLFLEYESFKLKPVFKNFIKLIDSVYKHNGRVKINSYPGPGFEVPQDILIYADTNNIVKFTNFNKDVIEFTERGKIFVKFFSEDQNKLV